MDPLDLLKNLSIILAGVVGLVTFFTGVAEFGRQGRYRKAEAFVQMRRRFLENHEFRRILDFAAVDDPLLSKVSIQDRRNLIGFLEEIALMVNSGMIHRSVAYYMFGYYFRVVDRSAHLWDGLDRGSRYWSVFRNFAAEVADADGEAPLPPSRLRF